MSDLPAFVRVCGRTYIVEVGTVEDSQGDCAFGVCDHKRQTIKIEERLCRQQRASTLLHECIEEIARAHELPLEHRDICTLETALFDLLTSNPSWW
jgi:hypothetical protein